MIANKIDKDFLTNIIENNLTKEIVSACGRKILKWNNKLFTVIEKAFPGMSDYTWYDSIDKAIEAYNKLCE